MGLKSFLSGLFYKKNLKNIMIFLIALIGLMLIFGNNNLVLTEGLPLGGAKKIHDQANIDASKQKKQYEEVKENYNKDANNDASGFTNIEPFEGQNPTTCGGQNNSEFMPKVKVNGVVNNACLITKNIEAQRKNNNSNNYDKVPTPSHPNVTKETLIQSKEAYKAGNMNMSNIKNSINRGIFNTEEADYITDGAYSN